jgi:cell division septal protein FtsQ
LGLCSYYIAATLFVIKKIVVTNPKVQVLVNDKLLNRHILFFPSDKLRTDLLDLYPEFADVIVRKKLPDTLIIDFMVRQPAAIVKLPARSVLVDLTGIVLGAAEKSNRILPVIQIGDENAVDGERLKNPAILGALRFLGELNSDIYVREITLEEELTLRVKSNESDILIMQNANMMPLASTLQILLTRFRMKGRMPVLIDLRFEKPVIRY